MTDTPETLQAALADLRDRHNEAMKSLAKWTIDVDSAIARVAAFEQAQKRAEEEEPPVCSETLLRYLEDGNTNLCGVDYQKAAREIRYLRRELARLKEENDLLRRPRVEMWQRVQP